MEPQGKVWSGDSGRKFAITSHKLRQTLVPFNGVGEFHSDMKTYPYTLFRFPLRQCASNLSERCYDIGMLKELLEALKEEAEVLLVFLRSVVVVRVIEISATGDHSTLFEVSIKSADREMVIEKRQMFLRELKSSCLQQRKRTYRISYETKFCVQAEDLVSGNTREKSWLVTSMVGSDDPQDLQAANKLKVLPWVGCALELHHDAVDESEGRLFCFLPLPHETRSPLPIHVNGTFGLDDNRRTLKWPSRERKHDSAADWNMTIVRSLLPHCYSLLIKKAIEEGFPPDKVYASWPQCEKLKRTPWSELMLPLFNLLFAVESLVLWSKTSPEAGTGNWVSLQCATIINSEISLELHQVLSACGLQLVDFTDSPQIREAVRVVNKKTKELSSSLVRQTIRSTKYITYQNLPPKTKHVLLHYCLLDDKFNELEGLELLPLADESFTAFVHSSAGNACYICSDSHHSGLLPGLMSRLVDVKDQHFALHQQLQKVAASKKTQIQKLNVEAVSLLLPQCMPAEWKNKKFAMVSDDSAFSTNWFRIFWEWLARHDLTLFEEKMVLPVVKCCSRPKKLCITKLVKKSSVVYLSEDSVLKTNEHLKEALEKFNIYFTGPVLFPFLQNCNSLREYVCRGTPHGVLSAMRNAYIEDDIHRLQEVNLTREEAEEIQQFLPDLQSQDNIVKHLPIFICENSSTLHSLASAAQESWGGKAVVVSTPSNSGFECKADFLPPNLLLLCPTYHQKLLVKPYIDIVVTLHWVDLVLKYLFPIIKSSTYPSSKVELLIEELLDQLSSKKVRARSSLVEEIKSIPFLRKDSKSALLPPCKMFDPSIPLLQDIVPAEMFPKKPFNKSSLLPQLRECGLREALTAQEVLNVMTAVGKKKKITAEAVSRASCLLEYMDSHKYLMHETVKFEEKEEKLKNVIHNFSKKNKWLPQLVKPPDYYPSCLPWKGKTLPHLVSVDTETLVCSQKNLKRDCMKVGSAVCIVVCPDSLSIILASQPKVSMVVKHLNEVIKCCVVLEKSDIKAIMEYIYDYLQKKTESYSELKSSLPSNWIWIAKISKFLSTKSLHLKRSASMQQDLQPYMYILPESLQMFSGLFKAMGVKETVTESQLVNVLAAIKRETDKTTENSEDQWMSVMAILASLTHHGKKSVRLKPSEKLYVPTNSESLQLEESTKVFYADYDFLQEFLDSSESEDKCTLCHEKVRYMAPQLHLTALSEHYELSEDLFQDFGPHEPLIRRLKNILHDYRDGLTIIKELLQNADDAGATEVNICYDTRQHNVDPKTLLYSGMSECSGPALVVHNNATFTDEDFQNITKLAAATKRDKPLKIGKFGMGFCSVYHITDVPCFVSREYLYIFDPTLQFLEKHIRDKSRPGKRLNFTKKIATLSNQLVPFVGLYEFDPKKRFSGTIFRFPFRTSASDISTIKYNNVHVDQLRKDIQVSGPKLLLFLQNVSQITFSRIDEGGESPQVLLEISKDACPIQLPLPDTQLLCMHTCRDDKHSSSHWLVGSCKGAVDFGGKDTPAVASVAISMEKSSDVEQFSVVPVQGEVFCFLPLDVMSGLPAHVSANFAVLNDRSGIRTSEDCSTGANEAEWNVDLMKSIIPRAYLGVLQCLSEMHRNKEIEVVYKCYSLLPLKENLKTHNPWDFLVAPLYDSTNKVRLLFSEYTRSWLTISEGVFLSRDIFTSSKLDPDSVQACVRLWNLPVIDMPSDYEAHLPPHYSLEVLEFVTLFFDRIEELRSDIKIRNKILRLILLTYWQAPRYKHALKNILVNKKCVPCEPDGQVLKYCHDVIDPNAFFANLYETTDGVFPVVAFQKDPATNQALISLGMVTETLHPSRVVDRAKTIEALHSSDPHRALKRAKTVFKCVSQYTFTVQLEHIKSIKFVPVKERPKDYPKFIGWKGDDNTLLAPESIYCDQLCGILAGSQVCVACTEEPEHGGCGSMERSAIKRLGMKTTPRLEQVVKHFLHLIREVSSRKEIHECTEWVTHVCSEIYQFFEDNLREGENKSDLSQLENCVWTGSCFVSPNIVASEWEVNGPYLFPIPACLKSKRHVLSALEIKDHFSINTFVDTLQKLKNEFRCTQIDKKCETFLFLLLTKLGLRVDERSDWQTLDCFLPDSKLVLRRASELDYADADWCDESSGTYVHPNIPRNVAIMFGVRPIRAKLLDEYEDTYEGIEFGQSEELTQRIKNILEDYPFDITVLKELLQNADDAKASEMLVIIDKRFHRNARVPSKEWAELQGPALLVWNDSTFSKEDLEGIQRLGLGSKRSESETIGMYGIGFNVVYHLTNCPSFISTERDGESTLCVLDPHCRYIHGARTLKPGRRFTNLNDRFWGQWSDMGSAFLRNDKVLAEKMKCGSLFRFPLRYKQELVNNSQLVVDSSEPMTAERMEDLLLEWAPEMKATMFFLNNVTEIQFIVIDKDDSVSLVHHYKATITVKGQQCRKRLHRVRKEFSKSNPTPCLETYTLTIMEEARGHKEGQPKKWLIQQGVGDIQKPDQHWQYMPKMKPVHGIAAPLTAFEQTEMRLFCFLPLPVESHLPVQVNGNFILHSSRRQLWQPTTSHVDDKTKWNQNLIEAIASSYSYLLANFKENFIPDNSTADKELLLRSIAHYYGIFPVWLAQEHAPERECLRLAKMVYSKLRQCNEAILVHIDLGEDKYLVQFLPLFNDNDPSKQPYFYNRDEESLTKTLRQIGMHLTEAPALVCDHFSQTGRALCTVTRESVFEYYSKFSVHVFSTSSVTHELVTETKFRSVEDFKRFTLYLLEHNESGFLEYPKPPFCLPLLLTADANLRSFDKNNKAIRTEFSDLFSSCRKMFLHPKLLDIEYKKDYFLKPGNIHRDIVRSIMSSTLPTELKCEVVPIATSTLQRSRLKELWKCLSKEEFFLVHLRSILNTWALVPSKSGELFSSNSTFFPIIETSDSEESQEYAYSYATQPVYYDSEIFKILNDLGMPVVDEEMVHTKLAEKICPNISNASAILANLFHLHQKRKVLLNIPPRCVGPLLRYCSTIHLQMDNTSLQMVKSLPLFRNVDGKLCSIEKGAFIWPEKMCAEGKDLWLCGDGHVFLAEGGEWMCLNSSVLGIEKISPFTLYTKYIFPVFCKLSEQQRLRHLQEIRDSLYETAEQRIKDIYIQSQEEERFIECIKKLCFIPMKDGSLHSVSEFADPRNKILIIFQNHFKFPPEALSGNEWLDFLVKVGLRTSITTKKYLQFCFEIMDGKHSDLKAASRELMQYLFDTKEWHTDKHFLREVSQIPFVCAESLPKVAWIRKCAPSQKTVQQESHTFHLTSLAHASDHEHHKLIWTVKPVVHLPTYPEFSFALAKQKRKGLLLLLHVLEVTAEEVVENIRNISLTSFSDFQNFETYSRNSARKCEKNSLIEVISENFKFLQEKASSRSDVSSLLSPLNGVPCIPVCAEGNIAVVTRPVLVKPLQVIAHDSPSVQEFMPFLNRLPHEFYSILPSVLSKIGVEQSIMLRHIQSALETVYLLCAEQKPDVNTINVLKKLIGKLYELLHYQPQRSELKSLSENVLYLPNSEYILVDSRTLLYQDSGHFRRTTFTFEKSKYSELHLLVPQREVHTHYKFHEKDLCQLIPHDIAPKPLTSSCREVISRNCHPEASLSQLAKGLQRACRLPRLVAAARAILKHQSNPSDVCDKLKGSLEHFFRKCEVVTVRNLVVDLRLKIITPEEHIGTAQVDFHIAQKSDSTFCLYVDKDARKTFFHESLSIAIMAIAAELCGVKVKAIKDPQAVLTHLLKAESTEELETTLREIGAGDFTFGQGYGTTEEGVPDSLINPVLGEPLPEHWHHRLQQDYNNIFRPGEMVGYEVDENHIVFASVGYKVQEGDGDFVRYCIYLEEGEAEGLIVSVFDIYKIRRSLTRRKSSGILQELVVREGGEEELGAGATINDEKVPKDLNDIKKEIFEELKKIWKLGDDMKRKAIKRMYLKWHPDKNRDNTEIAEEAFKYLKRQVERLQEGKPMEDPEGPEEELTTPEGSSSYTSSFWESFFRTWDNTAHNHSQYQQREETFSAGSYQREPFGFDVPDPTAPDREKARKWIRQAECDYRGLSILADSLCHDVCANVCFLAHEVAEKALKAGMLAMWGLRPEDFKNHKKMIDFAINLEQKEPQLASRGLLKHVEALPTERFYYKTRWPNWYGPCHEVPAEHFDYRTAQNAQKDARAILEMIKSSFFW